MDLRKIFKVVVLIMLFTNALILFLSAFGEAFYTSYSLVKNASWYLPSVDEVIREEIIYSLGEERPVATFYAWYAKPNDWLGLHKVCTLLFTLPIVMMYAFLSSMFVYLSMRYIYWCIPELLKHTQPEWINKFEREYLFN